MCYGMPLKYDDDSGGEECNISKCNKNLNNVLQLKYRSMSTYQPLSHVPTWCNAFIIYEFPVCPFPPIHLS